MSKVIPSVREVGPVTNDLRCHGNLLWRQLPVEMREKVHTEDKQEILTVIHPGPRQRAPE